MPANLEGCLVLGVFIAFMIAVIGGGLLLARAFDSLIPEIVMWLLAAAAFFAFTRFSKRHS